MDWRNLVEIQSLNLTENTAKMYLACLDLSLATAQQIAKNALVNRSSAHKALAFLIENGFIEEVGGKKVKKFRPIGCEQLKEKMEMIRKTVDRDVQSMEALYGYIHRKQHSQDFEVSILEGKQVKDVFQLDAIREKSPIYSIYNIDDINTILSARDKAYKNYIYTKPVRVIRFSKKHGRKKRIQIKNNPCIWQLRLKPGIIPFHGEINIYGKNMDKVFFWSYDKEIKGFYVKNKKFAQSMIALFHLIWENQ